MTQPFPEVPGYEIIEKMADGGMGTVFVAFEPRMRRKVALKVLHAHLMDESPEFRQRFQREARLTASLHHPHIIRVYEEGTLPDGSPFMAMQLIEGATLKDVIKQEGLFAPHEALKLMHAMARALSFAHGEGLVHRDIKPSNILVDQTSGHVVLSDFGIARMRSGMEKITATGVIMGTPSYISPEQAMGSEVDGKTDVYSLGIMLYEMLTGHVPYHGQDMVTILMKHITTPLPALPKPLMPLWSFVQKACAKDPAHRPTAVGLISLLEDLLRAPEIVELKALEAPVMPAADEKTQTLESLRHTPSMLTASPLHEGYYAPEAKRSWIGMAAGMVLVASAAAGGGWWMAQPETEAPLGVAAMAPAVAPQVEVAGVRVKVNPSPVGVEIFMDGQKVGIGRCSVRGVQPGDHLVEAIGPVLKRSEDGVETRLYGSRAVTTETADLMLDLRTTRQFRINGGWQAMGALGDDSHNRQARSRVGAESPNVETTAIKRVKSVTVN